MLFIADAQYKIDTIVALQFLFLGEPLPLSLIVPVSKEYK
jgi:hypothetical protein